MISLAVAAAGWVGVSSPGDYVTFKFPPLPRHDRKPAVVVLSETDYRQLVAAARATRESFADHLLAFPGDPETGDRPLARPRDVAL